MEVVDQFASPFPTAESVDVSDPWHTPAVQEDSTAPTVFGNPFTTSSPAFGADVTGENMAQARRAADGIAASLQELSRALEAGDAERKQMQEERAQLLDRMHTLEEHAAAKEQIKDVLLNGAGAALSREDLQAMQSMTDSLTQDPDRLTVLFNVVQQAPKLATVVNVFTQLRAMAEEL